MTSGRLQQILRCCRNRRDHTLVYKNVTHLGKRTQHCQYAGYAEPVELTGQLRVVISSADIICLAPLLPNYPASYVRTLLADRKSTSLAVLLPQGYLREVTQGGAIRQRPLTEASALVALFDLVILSEVVIFLAPLACTNICGAGIYLPRSGQAIRRHGLSCTRRVYSPVHHSRRCPDTFAACGAPIVV